jgi:5-methylcytosine-specific restriction protein A
MFETREERQRFYQSKAWDITRQEKLNIDSWCEEHARLGEIEYATEVHHIVDLAIAPHKALDLTNLMSLCKPCHSKITAAQSIEQYKESDCNHIWQLNVHKY